MNIYITIITEFLLLSSCILLLFKLRVRFGLAPLYILLGAVQFLQANLDSSLSFKFFGGYIIYPGSVILFSGVLFAVLLIYIKEGVASARTLIIGIIFSNVIMSMMFEITYFQQVIDSQINNTTLNTNSIFNINFKYLFSGTLILFIDFLLLVILYQYLFLKFKKLHFFLVLFISLWAILIFDSVAFNIALFYGTPIFETSLLSHLLSKSIAAIVYSTILYLYLKYLDYDNTTTTFIATQERDIFSILNYRKKYQDLKVQKKIDEEKLTSQIEITLNNISDGFISLDTNWNYTYVNQKAGEILGRTPSSLMGKHIWTEFPEGVGLPFYMAYYKAVETQETQRFQEYYKPFDKWLENRIYPSADGLAIYFTDITEQKNAENLLVENRNYLDSIINNIGDPVFVKDEQSCMLIVNDAFCKMFSLSRADIIGKTLAEDVTPEEMEIFLRIDKQVLSSGIENINEESLTIRDDETRIISTKKTKYVDERGVVYLIGVIRDITQKKKSEANSQMLLSLIETSDDFIGLASLEGEPVYLNKLGKEMVGLETDEELPANIGDFFPKHYRDIIANEHMSSIYEKNKWNGEAQFKNFKTGGSVPIEMSGFLIKDSITFEPIAMGIVATNITIRKKAEIELEKHKNNLEKLVVSRTTELEKEKIKAQSADLMKSAFLATMSHELRTPMNSIIGFTGMLLNELPGPLNDEQSKQLAMVKNSSEHLLGLINDILDISKIEAGRLEVSKSPFNYLLAIENTIEFLSPQANKKGLQISTEFSETKVVINSDVRRIEQVLLNLISNAIKFSNQGTILVKVDINNNFLTTQIIDEGIGISKENLNKLFMPFTQLEKGLSRIHEGTGLGLAICKSIIEKLEGTIKVTSKEGEGSNFIFILPIE